jgi:PmbA protein
MGSSNEELLELAEKVVSRALERGATVAEASAGSGWELSTRVRLGAPELVEEAGHKGVSLRVIKDQRVAMTSTSDLSEQGLERCVADALELAELSEADPHAGPADTSLLSSSPHPDVDAYDERVASIDAAQALARAIAAERAALDLDERITLSEGATFSRVDSTRALVLSNGFAGVTQGSYASLSVAPVAPDTGDKRRRGSYWTARRHLEDLESPEEVGREAARRTIAKLGAKSVPTCEAPVVFDPDVARSLLGAFAGCIVGGAIWRKSSYLADREGDSVASPLIEIMDDPLIPRAPGSRPFDGEGLRSRKNVVVSAGKLQCFLLDSYSARKLGRESTASAARSGGAIGASTSNFFMKAGTSDPVEIVKTTKRGLYVTELMGFGFNPVTGDFSRGAAGFWIEDGEKVFPVSEITISSNLDTMFKNIDLLGSDLDLKTSVSAPTFRISSKTIAGS